MDDRLMRLAMDDDDPAFDAAVELAVKLGWLEVVENEDFGPQYETKHLLSCPFCGGEPRHFVDSEYSWVDCKNCQAHSKAFDAYHPEDKAYIALPVIQWNSSAPDRKVSDAQTKVLKETGLVDKHYWELIDKRLAKNGIRL